MNERQFRIAVENSETFKSWELFKQRLVLKKLNLSHLLDLYGQAERLGIDYLRQNRNLSSNDVKLIEELVKK